jgi:beta-lactamase superfamily II metal-dependent hydrolase
MLEFFFWDVQHGHATYVRTPNGRHIAVDLGTGSYSTKHEFSPLRHLRTKYGVKHLDYVIITHPHRDHIDDIFEFGEMTPKTLLRPGHLTEADIVAGNKPTDSAKVRKYLEISNSYNAPVTPGTDSDASASAHWGGVKISYFVPKQCDRKNLNNHSIVTVFEYAGMKAVLPGDNEKPSWLELLKDSQFCAATINSDVLLAPHHGRDAGYCTELMDHVKPRVVVISDGPEGETSVTEKYGSKIAQHRTNGWKCFYKNSTWDERFCVTTRCDGLIRVQLGQNQSGRYLRVLLHDGTGKYSL